MQTRRCSLLFFVVGAALPLPAQDAAPPAVPTVDELITQLRAREQTAKTVSLHMRSRTVVPDGPVFETEGSLRVLGTTHFHVAMKMRAGEGMEGENEVVRTPNATWTREVDPMHGEVYTQMGKDTMRELEEASRLLGEDAPAGAVPGQSEAPLGSAMLASLAKRFDLAVTGKLVRDGLDHWLVRGDVRPRAPGEDPGDFPGPEGLPVPDRVELLVRMLGEGAFAVVRMAQFAAGVEIMSVEIEDVQIDVPMAEASFKVDARGKRVIDVMEHPPAAMQIKDLLQRAQRKREAEGKAGGERDKGEETKKDGGGK